MIHTLKKTAPNSDFAFYGNANAKLNVGNLQSASDQKVDINNKAKIF